MPTSSRRLSHASDAAQHATDGRAVAGFDVDLAAAAARALGVPLEIVLVDRFDDLLPGLAPARYDVVMSGLTRTLARARHGRLHRSLFRVGLAGADAARARACSTLASLGAAHARVVVRAGTTAESFAARRARRTVRARAAIRRRRLRRRRQRRSRRGRHRLRQRARRRGARPSAARRSQALEDRRFTVEHFAFAVRQGDADWLGWLNLMLRESKASGEFHVLAARYNAWFRSER